MYQNIFLNSLKLSLIVVLRSFLFFIYSILFWLFIVIPIYLILLLIGLRDNTLLIFTFIFMLIFIIACQNLFNKWRMKTLKYFYFEDIYFQLKIERFILKRGNNNNLIKLIKSIKSIKEIKELIELARQSSIEEIESKNKKWLYRVGFLSTWNRDEVENYFNHLHELLLLDDIDKD